MGIQSIKGKLPDQVIVEDPRPVWLTFTEGQKAYVRLVVCFLRFVGELLHNG